MKKVLTGILTAVLIVAVVGAVVIFAFEKKVPTNWFNSQIEAIKASKFSEDGEMPKTLKYMREEIKYEKDGDKTVSIYEEKAYREFTNNSTAEEEGYEIKSVDYDEHGNVKEEFVTKYYMEDGKYIKEEKGTKTELDNDDKFSEVALFFLLVGDFYEDDGTLKTEIVELINEHLESVTSKGLRITLHLVQDNVKVDLSYSLTSKKIVKIDCTMDTYDGDVLTNRVHEYISY